MRQMTIQVSNEQDTERVAAQIANLCFPGAIIAMDGDLGAGKTRLTRSIAQELGVEANVNSPTFTIVKEYEGRELPLYHMDVYRISEQEASELGLEEYFDGDGVSIVEWASIIEDLLPPERFELHIEVTGPSSRRISMKAYGERYQSWIDALQGHSGQQPTNINDASSGEESFYWLAIDTATSNMTIAVMNHLRPVAASDLAVERNHSIRLIPEIERLLQSAGIGMKDIRAVATGQGPGSYTGVRISVTVAKTLAWSLGIPLISVSSIGALAWGYVRAQIEQNSEAFLAEKSIWVIPIIDARRGQVFTSLYGWLPEIEGAHTEDGDTRHDTNLTMKMTINDRIYIWRELGSDRILSFSDWTQHILDFFKQTDAEARPVRLVFVGETEKFADTAAELQETLAIPVTIQEGIVQGQDLARLAWDRLNKGETDDVHSLTPNYTQLAEAEQKLLSKHK